ncbi:hypothetical protein Dimus_000288 [Dionaea muscipula]
MADLRVDEWLPVGWNLEVKVGRNGKKETFYVDPANGNMFRSIKDIDRYLLTGKLGRNVVKPKQRDIDSSKMTSDIDASPSKRGTSKKKKSEISNGSNKLEKLGRNAKMKLVIKSQTPNEVVKPRKAVRSSDRKKESVPFFRGDSAPGGEGTTQSRFRNIPEIVDFVKEEGQSCSTSYLPATAIGAVLGMETSDNNTELNVDLMSSNWVCRKDPDVECQLFQLEAAAAGADPGSEWSCFPQGFWMADQYSTEAEIFCKVDNFGSISDMLLGPRESESLFSVSPAIQEKNQDHHTGMVGGVEAEVVEDPPGSPLGLLFGDLCSDPCIDFAIKTLTGAIDPAIEDYLQMQQLSSINKQT